MPRSPSAIIASQTTRAVRVRAYFRSLHACHSLTFSRLTLRKIGIARDERRLPDLALLFPSSLSCEWVRRECRQWHERVPGLRLQSAQRCARRGVASPFFCLDDNHSPNRSRSTGFRSTASPTFDTVPCHGNSVSNSDMQPTRHTTGSQLGARREALSPRKLVLNFSDKHRRGPLVFSRRSCTATTHEFCASLATDSTLRYERTTRLY